MVNHKLGINYVKKKIQKFDEFPLKLDALEVPHPNTINLMLTATCNLKCKMCYNWKAKNNKMYLLSTNHWKDLIKDLRKKFPDKETILAFTGSESMLHPDIYELINIAMDLKFEVWLHSNGSLINEKTAKKLSKSGLKNISLSLDSIYEEEHNLMRGSSNNYMQVLKSIDYLYNNKINFININSVICNYNLNKIEDLIIWVQNNKKINTISLQAIVQPFNSGPISRVWYTLPEFSDLWPKNKNNVTKVLSNIIGNKEKHSKLINNSKQLKLYIKYFNNPLLFVNHYGCNVGSKIVNINSKGSFSICPDENSGNIKYNKIQDIWDSNQHKKIFANMSKCTKNCHLLINCAYEDENPKVANKKLSMAVNN